ncbi:MAG: argininosuccinate synthase [Pseudomonadota bacterium]
MSNTPVVLAFSGGLDTSYCVPWLREQGYEVTTLFVDSGGVSREEVIAIEARAHELGAVRHVTFDGGDRLWQDVVIPLVRAGATYQDQYPLLCSDRYLVVQRSLELCREIGASHFAHGCTGMGNDQVRFDIAAQTLGDATGGISIVAPVRETQAQVDGVRDYEMAYLRERGFGVSAKASRYTVNENLLGVTISGNEIDEWQAPGEGTWQLCRPRAEWPTETMSAQIEFVEGVGVALDGEAMPGAALLQALNQRFGAYGVGRGIYTGDTCVGLKGRIVFEAPGLTALLTAHRALEEAVSSRLQNRFKPMVADKWVELAYEGLFFDPLRADLEAYLASAARCVNGRVTLSTDGAKVHATAVESAHLLRDADAVYAQKASWSGIEAQGFIRLFGQSSRLWSQVNGGASSEDQQ